MKNNKKPISFVVSLIIVLGIFVGTGTVGIGPSAAIDSYASTTTPAIRMSDVHIVTIGGAVTKHWGYDAINFVLKKYWMNGTSDKTFSPDVNLTRAMVAQTLANMANYFPNGYKDSIYTDVKVEDWCSPAISWATQYKIMGGEDGKFLPNNLMAREDVINALYQYAKTKNHANYNMSMTLDQFTDATNVGSEVKTAMLWATSNKIISGKTSADGGQMLDPKGNITRSELASILYAYDNAF